MSKNVCSHCLQVIKDAHKENVTQLKARMLGEVAALIQSERRKAAIEILLRIRDKTDFMRGAGMELNIESTIWNELEVLDPSLNDKRIAELESNTEKERS
jgi:hypothetical protein